MRLLIRGGSISAGVGVSVSYADIVREYCTSRGNDCINRSRIGDTSFDGIWSFYEDIDPYRPDVLLLHFGVDDAYSSVYRSEFKENLVRLVRLAEVRFHPVIFLLTSHTFDNPNDMDAVNIYYRAIREVSVDPCCEMIPIHTYWAGYMIEHGRANADLVQRDTRYPNDQGHELFAEAVITRLERSMSSDRH